MPAPTPTTTTATTSAPARSGARTSSPAPAPSRVSAGSERRAGLSEQAAVTAIEAACRTLHLPTLRDRAPDAIAAAERGRHTYAALLAELLLAECDARDDA